MKDCVHSLYYLLTENALCDLMISHPTHHFGGQFAYNYSIIGTSSLTFLVHDGMLYIIGFGVVLNQASGC